MKPIKTLFLLISILVSLFLLNCAIVYTSELDTDSNNKQKKSDIESKPFKISDLKLLERVTKESDLNVYSITYNRSFPEIIEDRDSSYIRICGIGPGCGCPYGFVKRSSSKDTLIYEYSIYDGCQMECSFRFAFVKDNLSNFNVIKFVREGTVLERGTYVKKPISRYLWINGYEPKDSTMSIPRKKTSIKWIKKYGGEKNDKCSHIEKTKDHGYIICGTTESFGKGDKDAWLIKTDSLGDTLWTKTFGNPKENGAYYVQQSSDGGFILCGYTFPKRSFWEPDSDFWIIKTDSLGDTLWTKTIGENRNEVATSIIETPDSGFLFCGTIKNYNSSTKNTCIIKLDQNGNELWRKKYEKTRKDPALILSMAINGFLRIGTISNQKHHSLSDIRIVKSDWSGDSLWFKSFGGLMDHSYKLSNSLSIGLSERIADNQMIIGTSRLSEDSSAWILDIDLKNDSISEVIVNEPKWENYYCITKIKNSGYLLGTSKGSLYKVDSTGSFLWKMSFEKSGLLSIRSILTVNANEFILLGTSSTNNNMDIRLTRIFIESNNKQNQEKAYKVRNSLVLP